jgi:hypothetical protein
MRDQGSNPTIDKRIRRVQENLMGNEALGESLDEAAASELLSMGLKGAAGIASATEGMDEEAAEISMADRLKALRKLMRHLARLLGEAKDLDADGRMWLWNSVQKQARLLYGESLNFPSLDEVMGRLSKGESPGQVIANLRETFERQKNTSSQEN